MIPSKSQENRKNWKYLIKYFYEENKNKENPSIKQNKRPQNKYHKGSNSLNFLKINIKMGVTLTICYAFKQK